MRKKLCLCVFLLVLAVTHVAAAPLPEDAMSRLTVAYDKFEDMVTIRSSLEGYAGDGLEWIYLEACHNKQNLLYFDMKVSYISQRSIGLQYVIFLINGARYVTPTDVEVKYGGTSYGYVGESISYSVPLPEVLEIVKAIYDAGLDGMVEYKLVGSTASATGQFSREQLQAWHDVYDYCVAILGKPF